MRAGRSAPTLRTAVGIALDPGGAAPGGVLRAEPARPAGARPEHRVVRGPPDRPGLRRRARRGDGAPGLDRLLGLGGCHAGRASRHPGRVPGRLSLVPLGRADAPARRRPLLRPGCAPRPGAVPDGFPAAAPPGHLHVRRAGDAAGVRRPGECRAAAGHGAARPPRRRRSRASRAGSGTGFSTHGPRAEERRPRQPRGDHRRGARRSGPRLHQPGGPAGEDRGPGRGAGPGRTIWTRSRGWRSGSSATRTHSSPSGTGDRSPPASRASGRGSSSRSTPTRSTPRPGVSRPTSSPTPVPSTSAGWRPSRTPLWGRKRRT